MLIKEYRIPLPLTVEEYRIAQLYMIAKKSREESKGEGSGVEILVNDPYHDGPGGDGQFTHKIYHVGSHLPGWLKSLLPKSALTVEEEAWNAYPYTKTRYTCPFVEKFSIEIETYYFNDNGHQENVFKLKGSDLNSRAVDVVDVVKDQLFGGDYAESEDPTKYVSQKTSRGPLSDNWLLEYWNECQGHNLPLPNGKAIMCAYKLCRVEFRYWGMQSKIEKFIHDIALRKTMLRAHRQAWAWQDEWYGLTMEDIREIEKETQEALAKTMGCLGEEHNIGSDNDEAQDKPQTITASNLSTIEKDSHAVKIEETLTYDVPTLSSSTKVLENPEGKDTSNDTEFQCDDVQKQRSWYRTSSKSKLVPSGSSGEPFDLQLANWRMESIRQDSGSSDDEFYDCQADCETRSLRKWGSLELIPSPEGLPQQQASPQDSIFSHTFIRRMASERRTPRQGYSVDFSLPASPSRATTNVACPTSILFIVFHGGSILDTSSELLSKKSDLLTFRGALESVIKQHYPTLLGHVAMKLIHCPSVCNEALGILSSLSPYSFDVSPSSTDGSAPVTHDSIPIGAIPMFLTSSPEYWEHVHRAVAQTNQVYHDFLKSEEGLGFQGQVCIIGDCVGSILAYDVLQMSYDSDKTTCQKADQNQFTLLTDPQEDKIQLSAPPRKKNLKPLSLTFNVGDFFMFGSPLPIVIAYRKISSFQERNSPPLKPSCVQVYNLFHPTDPLASRLEPLLSARFSLLPPISIPRYQLYPLGDGHPVHLLEYLQSNPSLFADDCQSTALSSPGLSSQQLRRISEASIHSNLSASLEPIMHTINTLTSKWWGKKRLDYALYCPEGLANFPVNVLPHLFHASYWESYDVIAFILRQLVGMEVLPSSIDDRGSSFRSSRPREKWLRKRTSVKLKNVAANHRGNDVIVREGMPQILVAKFMYGPLDMLALSGELVDVYVMKDAPNGEWSLLSTETTDKTGKLTYPMPELLNYGLYPIKMVVRGDHSFADFYLAVVPPKTECVVFSIDGSFTASVSVTGKDPKVRPGAVDVVRLWQELGYLIIYITSRPDMQHQKVISWLQQHNFPHGLVSFASGISTDPLGHKSTFLKELIHDVQIVIHAAYGSSKDISVYTSVGLKQENIYIIGKVAKKQQSSAQVLSEGYATHLTQLTTHGGSRPAQGNARMVLPRTCFGLPGQKLSRRSTRKSVYRK